MRSSRSTYLSPHLLLRLARQMFAAIETTNCGGCLIMSDNCYVYLGLGVIAGWFFSGVATFLILAIMHVGKRK